jgi:hypothetical protein
MCYSFFSLLKADKPWILNMHIILSVIQRLVLPNPNLLPYPILPELYVSPQSTNYLRILSNSQTKSFTLLGVQNRYRLKTGFAPKRL